MLVTNLCNACFAFTNIKQPTYSLNQYMLNYSIPTNLCTSVPMQCDCNLQYAVGLQLVKESPHVTLAQSLNTHSVTFPI